MAPNKQEEEAKARYQGTMQEAVELTAKLQADPVIQVLATKYRDRLVALARQDPECRALDGILSSLRYKLDLAPAQAYQQLLRVLGPHLQQFMEDKEEPQAAPEGIPT
ncbi:MAG: hypothetical protein HY915_16305 [Desulfovibrio sp.]|nr:hypothetical protein [Desulfovibrio sp.]